jgi:CheY-like chemotaxis protein
VSIVVDSRRRRILIVDDDDRTRRLLTAFLANINYDTVSASGGAEALSALREPDAIFDLVLLDIQMPGMDGTTVAREIRHDAKLSSLPILAFTAFSHPDDATQILEAGCDAYLSKPANLRELADIVESLIAEGPRAR